MFTDAFKKRPTEIRAGDKLHFYPASRTMTITRGKRPLFWPNGETNKILPRSKEAFEFIYEMMEGLLNLHLIAVEKKFTDIKSVYRFKK